MLSLSSSIAKLGYIVGAIMFFYASGNLFLGLYCFNYLMFKYPDTKVYSDLVKEILGTKFEKALNVIFITYVFGSLVAYILASKLKSLEIGFSNN